MSDRVLGLTIKVNSDQVKAGFDQALSASKAWANGLGQDAAAAGAAVDDIAVQVDKVTTALHKAETADGLKAQDRAAREASFGFEQLRQKIDAAEKAGVQLGPEVGRSLQALSAQVQATNTRLASAKDALGDMSARSKLLANDLQGVSGQAGSLQGLLGGLEQAGSGTAKSFAEMGIKGVAAAAAFTAGFEAGQKLRQIYQDLTGKELPNLTNAFVKLATGVDNATGAFDRHGVRGKSLVAQHNQLQQSVDKATDAFRKGVPEVDALARKQEEAGKASQELTKFIQRLQQIQGVDYQQALRNNAEAIQAVAKKLIDAGIAFKDLSPAVQAAIQQTEYYTRATKAAGVELDGLGQAMVAIDPKVQKANILAQERTERMIASAAAERDAIRAIEEGSKAYQELAERTRLAREAESALYAETERLAQEMRALGDSVPLDALRQMASVIEPVGQSIFDTNDAAKQMLQEFDDIAKDSLLGGYLNDIFNQLKNGSRTIEQTRAALEELRKLKFQPGAQFLGDIDTLINQMQGKLNKFADTTGQGLGSRLVDPLKKALDEVPDHVDKMAQRIDQSMTSAAQSINKVTAAIGQMASATAQAGSEFGGTTSAAGITSAGPQLTLQQRLDALNQAAQQAAAYKNQLAMKKRGL